MPKGSRENKHSHTTLSTYQIRNTVTQTPATIMKSSTNTTATIMAVELPAPLEPEVVVCSEAENVKNISGGS